TDGQIVVDQRFSEFAQASGRTLTISGYKITIDGRQLSHDLQVYGMYGNMPIMSNTTTHELTLIPQTQNGYLLQPGAYIADFYFGLTTDGQIVVDQRFSEFAQASGRTLTISGYKITIDGRQLSHDLQVYGMYGNMPIMSNTTTHELTLIPQTQNGYLLQPGAYIADFYFGLTTDGQIIVDQHFSQFAQANDRTLTISGYKITIDGRGLDRDLMPTAMYSDMGVLARDRPHEVTLIPAAGHTLKENVEPYTEFYVAVDIKGNVRPG
ncbi:hypothetical protein, partial [Actinomadura sp. 3N508]|uniref:hypothetical protein n=1 Tax=Actinomadura sp. 3N508 TaxID=3375153 RepID=UPI0037B26BB3